MSSRRRRELAWIFAVFFVAGAPVLGGPVPFTAQPPLSNGVGGARFVVAADFDRDGDLDAAAAARQENAVVWLENVNGDGSSWVEATITTSANGVSSVFAADVDGDGDVDVLSASRFDNDIEWYENTLGDGSAWALHTIADTVGLALSVHAADMDGDGDEDVLAGGHPGLMLFENVLGSGTSWAPHTISTAVVLTAAVVAADVDGDGDLDAVAASYSSDDVDWFENVLGDASSWIRHSISTTADGPYSVHTADVDGDGDLDALVASYLDDRLLWYENPSAVVTSGKQSSQRAQLGGGSSWAEHTISTSAGGPLSTYAVDVDGDGDVDVLLASFLANEIVWHENLGDGSSWVPRTITNQAEGAHSVAAADFDGDGDIDALDASGANHEIAWYKNESIHRSASVFVEPVVISEVADRPSLRAHDVDGDGDYDLVADEGDAIFSFENVNGDGSSWVERAITTSSGGASSVVATDLDGDGDLDAVYSTRDDGVVAWAENTFGDGSAWTIHTITESIGLGLALSLHAADMDTDGDTDVLVGSDQKLTWRENLLGSGTSWATHTISTTEGRAAVAAGDVDGDGDNDAVAASNSSGNLDWFEFGILGWEPHSITTTADGASSLFLVDVDGDANLDALAALGNRVSWWKNLEGDGSSWAEYTIDTSATGALLSVVPADPDADGDLDLFSTSDVLNQVVLHENLEGDGTSWARRIIDNSAGDASSVLAADLDNDGRTDLLYASDGELKWYRNGGGQFALTTTAVAQGVLADSQDGAMLEIELGHRGRVGDSDVELETLELRIEDGAGTALTPEEANALIAKMELFLDDGSGRFELADDTLVEEAAPLTPVAGVQSIELAGGGPDVEVAFGESKRYFVVVTLTADASAQTPDSFELVHLTESGSSARDASTPAAPFTPVVPLRLEHHADTATGLVDTDLSSETCKAPFELDLESFLVTTTLVCEAGTTLSAGAGLAVTATGDLTLRAGQRVRFVTDFSVQPGGGLAAEVDPSLEP